MNDYVLENKLHKNQTFSCRIDPLDEYTDDFTTFEHAREFLGLIPNFIMASGKKEAKLAMRDLVQRNYGMPCCDMTKISKLGGLKILGEEGESDLAPYAVFRNLDTKESIGIYPYGLCVFWVDHDIVFITRLD